MAQVNTAAISSDSQTNEDALQRSKEYYFAILAGSPVYHVAHDGETVCNMTLAEKGRWMKRGSEKVIPPEFRLCAHCDAAFNRELALSKRHIREELAALAGTKRRGTGAFSKRELAELLAGFRDRRGTSSSTKPDA